MTPTISYRFEYRTSPFAVFPVLCPKYPSHRMMARSIPIPCDNGVGKSIISYKALTRNSDARWSQGSAPVRGHTILHSPLIIGFGRQFVVPVRRRFPTL